ncbi:hypothetical protein [Halovulum sp. GXIMD14793]
MSGSFITSTIAVANAAPATFDQAGYEALTWENAGGVQTLPVPGWETNMIDVPDLTSGITKAVKGASAGRVSTVAFREIITDTGQTNIKSYAAPGFVDEVSVRITYPGGAVEYMSGLMHNYLFNEGTDSSFRGFTASFRQNYDSVVVPAP